MSKKLVLKPRLKDSDGEYTWHDKYVLGNALTHIAQSKNLMQLAPFISMAGKIELEAEKVKLGEKKDDEHLNLVEFSVSLNNQEAKLFWREIEKLPFDAFGTPLRCNTCNASVPNVPNVGILYQMLSDIATDLGETMPESEEDKDDIISKEEKANGT